MKTTDHPLFPPNEGEHDAPDVDGIHVTRFQGGKYVYCPYLFAPEELTSLQQVYDLFGGGQYELVARADGKMSAKRRYELDGRPRPLAAPGSTETEPPQPVAMPAAVAAPTGDSSILALVMQQGQQNAQMMMQMMQLMMTSQASASQQMQTLVTAMMTRDAESNKTLLQAMAGSNERSLQGQAQVFQTMLEAVSKGSGGGGLKEGIELGLSLAGTSEEATDKTSETLGQVVDGLRMVSALTGTEPPVPEGAAA